MLFRSRGSKPPLGRPGGRLDIVSLSIDAWRDWIGRTATADDVVALAPARALAATLDRESELAPGDPLPPPWHWLKK